MIGAEGSGTWPPSDPWSRAPLTRAWLVVLAGLLAACGHDARPLEPGTRRTEAPSSTASAATTPISTAPFAPEAEVDGGFGRVRVLGSDGQPRSGVAVEIWNPKTLESLVAGPPSSAWSDRFTLWSATTTDRHGTAFLETLPTGAFSVIARVGTDFALAAWPSPLERRRLRQRQDWDVTLRLSATRRITIQVLDPAGEPVPGVQLELAANRVPASEPGVVLARRAGTFDAPLTLGRTDARGELVHAITAEHPQLFQASSGLVAALLPGEERVEGSVDLSLADGRASLRLPATASVRLVPASNSACGATVTYEVVTSPRMSGALDSWRHSIHGRTRCDGVPTLLGGFARAATVRFTVHTPDREPVFTDVTLDGADPTPLPIAVGPMRPILAVTVWSPDERIAAGTTLTAKVLAAEVRSEPISMAVRTDHLGRVRIPISSGSGQVLLLSPANRSEASSRALATIRYLHAVSGTTIEGGVVRLDRGRLLVAGKVSTATGDAVGSGSSVTVTIPGSHPSSVTSSPLLTVSTDAQGAFSIYEDHIQFEGSTLLLTAQHGLARTKPMSVEAGTTDLELRLPGRSDLTGTVLCGDAELRGDLRVDARPLEGGPRSRGTIQFADGSPSGSFRIPGLAAGPVEVTLMVGSFLAQRATVALEVDAEPAPTVELVVESRFQRGEIFVVGDEDQPIEGARVTLRSSDDQTSDGQIIGRTAHTDADGRVRFALSLRDLLGIDVAARGYVARRVTTSTFPLRVTLERGRRIAFVLDPPIPTVGGVTHYRLELRPQDVTSTIFPLGVFAAGVTRVLADDLGVGAYDFVLTPIPAGDADARRRLAAVGPVSVGSVRIPPGPLPETWTVNWDETILRDAVSSQ